MKHLRHLPVWRDANRLLLEIEEAVRAFSRYHKYSVGADLRTTAMRQCQAMHRAWSRGESRSRMLQQLVEINDDLKLQIQLAKELKAFDSYSRFQRVAELAVGVGRQLAAAGTGRSGAAVCRCHARPDSLCAGFSGACRLMQPVNAPGYPCGPTLPGFGMRRCRASKPARPWCSARTFTPRRCGARRAGATRCCWHRRLRQPYLRVSE